MSLIRSFRYRSPGVAGALLWSSYFAGSGAGADIVVGSGVTVIQDMAPTPIYNSVTINGMVNTDTTKSTELRANSFDVNGGIWNIGSEATPYPRSSITATVTPTGPRSAELAANIDPATAKNAVPSNNRGLYVRNGGELNWVAAPAPVNIFKLGATAAIGATSLTAAVPVTFKAGDVLELGTSMYWQEGMSDLTSVSNGSVGTGTENGRRSGYGRESVTVASDVTSSTTIPLTSALTFRHHGQLQYLVPPAYEDVAGTNLSYTYRAIVAGDSFGTVNGVTITGTQVLAAIAAGAPAVVDNRATVGLMTHPIKFAGPNDSDWTTHGYGASMMAMDLTTKRRMQCVQIDRCGKAGQLGAYPIHDHHRSYTMYGMMGSGTYLGDVDPAANYTKYCSVNHSSNRGISIHGTCGSVTLQNVFSDTDTHCIFMEDGSEERNVIDGNFVSGLGLIGYGKAEIKVHDVYSHDSLSGPAGIWYTNPQNYLRNNIVAGGYIGIWNSMAGQCFGASRDVAIDPHLLPPLEWLNNESHSARFKTMQTTAVVTDELGNVADNYWFGDGISPTLIKGANLWKSNEGWYRNKAEGVDYRGWTASAQQGNNPYRDNLETGVFGIAAGAFNNCSFFIKTLDDYYSSDRPQVMVTYHNTVHRVNCLFIAAPMGAMSLYTPFNKLYNKGGSFPMWDYYENPVENQFTLDTGSLFLGANPGYPGVMFPPAFLLGQFSSAYMTALGSPTITLPDSKQVSGARKLPTDGGFFGQAGGWWVDDDPFLLYGTTGSVYAQAPTGLTNLNGKLVSSSYDFIGLWAQYASGVEISGQNTGDITKAKAINYTRYQADGSTLVGTWNTGAPDNNYFPKRHCATLNGAVIDTSWSRTDVPLPTSLHVDVWGMVKAGMNMTWALDWDGATAVTSATFATQTLASVASKALLLAASANSYWVDTTNNKIWTRLFVGTHYNDNAGAAIEAYRIHNPISVYIN